MPTSSLIASQIEAVVQKNCLQGSTVEDARFVEIVFKVRKLAIDNTEDEPPKLRFLMQQ